MFIGNEVKRFSLKTTFLEHIAGVAGGAVYMLGVTFRLFFEGVIFKSPRSPPKCSNIIRLPSSGASSSETGQ